MATTSSPESPLEKASVARTPDPAGKHASATLVPRAMGFLAVAVHFDGRRMAGLEARFFRANDDGSQGDALGEMMLTDARGVARLPRLVPIGHYVCVIEDEPAAAITTVHALDSATALVLPIGAQVVEVDDGLDLDRDGEDA
jgi:hypothetical protein